MNKNNLTALSACILAAALSLGAFASSGNAQTATATPTTTTTTTATPSSDLATSIATALATPLTAATEAATEAATGTATATPTPSSELTATTTPTPTTVAGDDDDDNNDTPDSSRATSDVITVDGIGQASAAPDSAIVEVGVQSQALTASVALSQTSVQVQSLIDALTAGGIAEDDIQTLSVNLFPVYSQPATPGGEQSLSGFNATNIVRVRVRQLDDLGELLDASVEAGANIVQSVRLELSDSDEALSEARRAAVDNARAKAEELATLADRELGDIRVIVESSLGVPIAFRDGLGGGAASVPIEPGSQSVQVVVQITWALR